MGLEVDAASLASLEWPVTRITGDRMEVHAYRLRLQMVCKGGGGGSSLKLRAEGSPYIPSESASAQGNVSRA